MRCLTYQQPIYNFPQMVTEAAKIERVRDLFGLPIPLLMIEIQLAEQSVEECKHAGKIQNECDQELFNALKETAELTLVIGYTLTDTTRPRIEKMEAAKAQCALMGINAFGVLDDPEYDPNETMSELGIHFN